MKRVFGMTPRSMIVTHVGPAGSEPGGMASVLREYVSWGWTDCQLSILQSYAAKARFYSVWPFLLALWRLLRAPQSSLGIIHVHLSERGAFIREGLLVVVGHYRGLPVCASIHGAEFEEFFNSHSRICLFVLRRTRKVFVLSSPVRDLLKSDVGLNVTVLPNAVSIPLTMQTSAGEGQPIVVFAGEVSRRKGADTLIAAWPRVLHAVPDAELLLFGPRTSDLVIKEDTHVTVAGPTDHSAVLAALETCRVAVLPSRAEAMPMFILEAMARARPVIATEVGGIAEVVGAQCGAIVQPGDVSALADAIIHYLKEPDASTADGMRARARAIDQYSAEVIQRRLRDEWRSIAKVAS
jgi:glycosyltransferase involved in cell wall biosynthesis